MIKQITREDAQNIVATSDAFYASERVVEGQLVEVYDYRLASYSDFFPEGEPHRLELRGLTFVLNPVSMVWERNLLLNKFFNYGQGKDWMPEDFESKQILRVQDKLDGSVISFVKFANSIRAKSKTSFDSDQAKMAQTYYESSEDLQNLVAYCFTHELTPIFELTSPDNQIVLEYTETKLVLLQVRRNDGTYLLSFDELPLGNIAIAKTFNLTLDDMLHIKKTSTDNIEGFIVTFVDDVYGIKMAKIKTDHYLTLHHLIGPDAFKENTLIESILNETIDDVIAYVQDGVKKAKITELANKLQHYLNHHIKHVGGLLHEFNEVHNKDRKTFAIKYKQDSMFSVVMRCINVTDDLESAIKTHVKEYVSKQCKTLSSSKEFIANISN